MALCLADLVMFVVMVVLTALGRLIFVVLPGIVVALLVEEVLLALFALAEVLLALTEVLLALVEVLLA